MDFNQIQLEVGKILLKKITLIRMPHLSVDDAISDAYLQLLEQGYEITKESVLRFAEKNIDAQRRIGLNRKQEFSKVTQRTCTKCNESKPTACFGLWYDKVNNCRKVQSYCKDCQIIAYKEWCAKNPNKYHSNNVLRKKKYWEENPKKYQQHKEKMKLAQRKKYAEKKISTSLR